MRLSAYWDANEGEGNFSAKEIRKVFDQHPMVTADFLSDLSADAQRLYDLSVETMWDTPDERARRVEKWLMPFDQQASIDAYVERVDAGRDKPVPGEDSTPAPCAAHSPAQQQNTPEIPLPTGRYRKAPLWPFAAIAAVAATLAMVIASVEGWI